MKIRSRILRTCLNQSSCSSTPPEPLVRRKTMQPVTFLHDMTKPFTVIIKQAGLLSFTPFKPALVKSYGLTAKCVNLVHLSFVKLMSFVRLYCKRCWISKKMATQPNLPLLFFFDQHWVNLTDWRQGGHHEDISPYCVIIIIQPHQKLQ